jgi:hypothetical protein
MPFLGPVNRQVITPSNNMQPVMTTVNNFVMGMGGDNVPGSFINARPLPIHNTVSQDMSSPHTVTGSMPTSCRSYGTTINSSFPPTYVHQMAPPMMNTTYLVHDNIPTDFMGYTNGPFVGHHNPRVIYQPVSLMEANNNTFMLNGRHLVQHPNTNNFIPHNNFVSHEPLYTLNLNQINPTRDGNHIVSQTHSPYIVKGGIVPSNVVSSSSSMGMVPGHNTSLGPPSSSSYRSCAPAPSAPNVVHIQSSVSSQPNKVERHTDFNAASTMLSLGDETETPKPVGVIAARTLEI